MDMTIEIEEIVNGKIEPAFSENNVPLCLFSSNDYAPYCGVLVQSVVENSTPEHNYDIVILERNISDNNKRLMLSLIEKHCNISIRFINVAKLSKELTVSVHGHFTLDNCIKIYLLSPLFSKYDKFVATDSDLVFNRDLAELYETDVENYYMAAVDDVIMKSLIAEGSPSGGNGLKPMPAGDYLVKHLNMKDSTIYFNTGVVVFNLKLCRENNIFKLTIDKLNSKNYWFLEQDVLNEICWKKTTRLPLKWNTLIVGGTLTKIERLLPGDIYLEYSEAREIRWTVHFTGDHKPWFEPGIIFSEDFFRYARLTPWYELILFKMSARHSYRTAKQLSTGNNNKAKDNLPLWKRVAKKFIMPIINLFLPKGSEKRRIVYTAYVRLRDKKLMREHREMHLRLLKMNIQGRIIGTKYYDNKKLIKSYKNKYKGERCFIIGNGPSLTYEDLNKLQYNNEITFSMNSIHKMFECTTWRPTYYVFNDIMLNYGMTVPVEERRKTLIECLSKYSFECCFISSSKYNNEIKVASKGKVAFLPTRDFLYHIYRPYYPPFPKNCAHICQAYGTTAFLAFQIAAYMGFKKIYFLGTDCTYSGENKHAYSETGDEKKLYQNKVKAKQLEEALQRGFGAIKKYSSEIVHVDVYNATRGGKLELFPRVDLDEMLGDRKE